MNQCPNCGTDITNDDFIIWKCQECSKRYKIKMSKIRSIGKQKDNPENNENFILKCRECGTSIDNGNENLSFKCKECGKIFNGNIEFFTSQNTSIKTRRNEESPKNIHAINENIIVCPECGEKINDFVDACPECGYPIKEELNKSFSDKPDKLVTMNETENFIEKKSTIEHKEYKNKTNGVGKVFYGIGWCIIIFGTLIEFMVTLINYNETYLSDERTIIITTFIAIELIIVISGLIPLGFAEIIFLLENIRDKLHDTDR